MPRAKRGAHVDAQLTAARVVFGAPQAAQLRYRVTDPQAMAVAVDLVRVPDGVVIAAWPAATVAPGGEQVVTWNGLGGGRVPRAGTYEFRVFAASPGAVAAAAQAGGPDATVPFRFAPNVFPIAGAHTILEGGGRFGAQRSGHVHQGQDVSAACGTALVAARAGTVKFSAFQARAGNYVVLDADKTGTDLVYMHLREPALPPKGAHVATGEVIGYVGDTGDAEGCHLHFELWSAPGWFTGGHAIDPLPSLLAWQTAG
jgi:murein DD-endopeptidase MepM/ murein hydrolase activator NlpD